MFIQRRKLLVATIFTLAGMYGCSRLPRQSTLKNLISPPPPVTTPGLVSDDPVREIATRLEVEDISYLRFEKISPCGNLIDVTDPSLIKVFLVALRHAETRPEIYLNRSKIIELKLKKPIDKYGEIVRLNFCAGSVADGLGPEFQNALPLLEGYQAGQLRQWVRSYRAQVKSIHFTTLAPATQLAEVTKILDALEQVNGTAFMFTREAYAFGITIKLNDGSVKEFDLALGPYDSRIPMTQQHPLVPPLLWDYCVRGQQAFEKAKDKRAFLKKFQ